jgi:phosphotransferase system IIA component
MISTQMTRIIKLSVIGRECFAYIDEIFLNNDYFSKKNFISESQSVKKGESLLLLEAMKMQNCMKMPFDGKIVKILCVLCG